MCKKNFVIKPKLVKVAEQLKIQSKDPLTSTKEQVALQKKKVANFVDDFGVCGA